MALVIVTVLTAYILALTMSNQAFAWVIDTGIFERGNGVGSVPVPSQHVLNSVLGQSAGQHLLHEDMKIQQLFPVYAAHETQQVNKVLSGEETQVGKVSSGELGQQRLTNGDTGSGSTLGSTNQPCSSTSTSITVRNQATDFDLIPCVP